MSRVGERGNLKDILMHFDAFCSPVLMHDVLVAVPISLPNVPREILPRRSI